ncbi:MAG: flagellar hook capping FlgD N-terminal domain-containing protein [Bryobacteraceae bacterium]
MTIAQIPISQADASSGAKQPAPATDGGDSLTSKDTFLKLLVAQIQNQNPLSPSDPIQFVSQLAQFSSLEQTLAMRESLDAIRAALAPASSAATGAAQGAR